MGVATFNRLIEEHGSAQAALAALPGIARAAGVDRYDVCPEGVARAELRAGAKAGARLICRGEADYPAALSRCDDAPPVLWIRGDAALLHRPMIALVGARNASSLGGRMARRLAEGLGAAGIVVVSGLARGIDANAHKAALDSGTLAVVAGGIDVVYPPENAALAADIAARGALITEQPPGLDPQARHFPLRNRIISGLSQAVVVVEGALQSGSLITAKCALDQGREVMAVPGHPFDGRAGGCNALIRDGATLVRGPEDVLAALAELRAHTPSRPGRRTDQTPRPETSGGPRAPVALRPQPRGSTDLHGHILDRLGPSPLAEDQLIRDLARPAAEIAAELLTLELDGQILRQPGGLLSRPG